MAKVTWLGEDDPETGVAGPSFTLAFGGIKFPQGVAVEVRDPALVKKATTNHFFKVEDADDVAAKRGPGRPPKMGPVAQQAAQISQNGIGKAAAN